MKVNIGKGLEVNVDQSRFTGAVLEHIIYLGLRNALMDSHASHTKEADGDAYIDNSLATAMRKLEAMYNGEVRVAGTREGDPVKAEAIRIALGHIKTAWRKGGKKLADLDAKAARDAALKLIEKNPSITTQAEKRVAELKAAEVDMTGITV